VFLLKGLFKFSLLKYTLTLTGVFISSIFLDTISFVGLEDIFSQIKHFFNDLLSETKVGDKIKEINIKIIENTNNLTTSQMLDKDLDAKIRNEVSDKIHKSKDIFISRKDYMNFISETVNDYRKELLEYYSSIIIMVSVSILFGLFIFFFGTDIFNFFKDHYNTMDLTDLANKAKDSISKLKPGDDLGDNNNLTQSDGDKTPTMQTPDTVKDEAIENTSQEQVEQLSSNASKLKGKQKRRRAAVEDDDSFDQYFK
jgi:predicted PurR-regulated permease PerM